VTSFLNKQDLSITLLYDQNHLASMLPTVAIKLAHIRPAIFSSIRLLHVFDGKYIFNEDICQQQGWLRIVIRILSNTTKHFLTTLFLIALFPVFGTLKELLKGKIEH